MSRRPFRPGRYHIARRSSPPGRERRGHTRPQCWHVLARAVETSSPDDFDRQYVTNVRAPYLLTQVLLPMLRATRGQIIFINSTVVFAASANVGQFAATQHALRAFVDALREEVNADGIRVASVFPGRTATPRQAHIHALEGKAYVPERLVQPDDVAEVVVNILTLPRSAEITDVRIRPMLKH